jgi:hypothetical protein
VLVQVMCACVIERTRAAAERGRQASLERSMGTAFWIRRFFTALVLVGFIVVLAQWAKGHTLQYAATQGVIWGPVSAAVFTVARIYQSRRRQHCAICKDTPEMAQPELRDSQ